MARVSDGLGEFDRFGNAIRNGDVLDPVVKTVANDIDETASALARKVAGVDRRLSNYRRRTGGRGGAMNPDVSIRGDSATIDLVPRGQWAIVLGGTRRHVQRPGRSPFALEPAEMSRRGTSGRPTLVRSGSIRHPGHRPLGRLDIESDLDQIPALVDRQLERES